MTKPRTGTMTERAPGVWRLQVTSEPDAITGRTRRLSRTHRGTRTEAKGALQRLVVDSGAGLQGGSDLTIAALLDQFIATATLAPTTRQDWHSVINRHLIPGLGTIPLWKLTARDCDQLYLRLADQGLGPSRVRNAHTVLHRAVAQAVRWGWVARNPVSDATRPDVPRATVVPPDLDQVRQLLALARASDSMLACWLDIAAATGARRGEICALRWSDIDLHARTVRIERSVSATKADGVIIKTTKTDRFRLVTLTHQAITSVSAELERAQVEAARAGRAFERNDLVFTNDPAAQVPWRPELVTRRWERLRARAGFQHVKVHGLRHFVATELLTAGIDIRTVANRLGHARTSTTLDIYWAWVPARDRDAADHLQAVLGALPNP
jgi:integrase